MFHVIHAIPPPSEVNQHGGGDSVSENNINKVDGTWAQEKILVWIFNGKGYTLQLPAEKFEILDRLQNIKRFTTKKTNTVMEKLAYSLHRA